MSIAAGPFTAPARERKAPAIGPEFESQLSIFVIFTSVKATLAALKTAAVLADRLRARITLVVPQVVPYALPLDRPQVPVDFSERRFRVIAAKSGVDTTVRLYLCREPQETIMKVLRPYSLVVVGGRKSWWPTWENRLARRLRRAGHDVVVTKEE